MREANKANAKYAIIIGDKELESGKVEIKDLSSGIQQRVPLVDLLSHLNSLSI